MEKIKKLWKEISVFGVVIVVFLGLFLYRKIMFAEYILLSETNLVDKLEDKDDFIVVVGSSSDNTTLSYQQVMQKFVDKNRGETLYFVDLASNTDAADFIKKTFTTEDGSIPQTFVIKDGEVTVQKTGSLSYYRLNELYK